MNKFLTMSLLAGASFLGINNAMSQDAPTPKTANARRATPNFNKSYFDKTTHTMVYSYHALSNVTDAKEYDLYMNIADTNGDNIFGNAGDKAYQISFNTGANDDSDYITLDFATGQHTVATVPNGSSDSYFIQKRKVFDKTYKGELPTLLGFIKNLYGITLTPDVDFDKTPPFKLKESLISKVNFDEVEYNYQKNHYIYFFNEKPGFTEEGDDFTLAVSYEDTNNNKIFGDREDRIARVSYNSNNTDRPLVVLDFDKKSAAILTNYGTKQMDITRDDLLLGTMEFTEKYGQANTVIPHIEKAFGFDPFNGANLNSAFPRTSDRYKKMGHYAGSAYSAAADVMIVYFNGQNGVENAGDRAGMLFILDTNKNDVFGDERDEIAIYGYNTTAKSKDIVMVDLQNKFGYIQLSGDTRPTAEQRAQFDTQIGSMDMARLQFKKLIGINPTP